jgi:Tol biopolymer transport system component
MATRLLQFATTFLLTSALPLAAQSVSVTPAGSARGPVARVAYVSDELTDETFELFGVPTDGSAPPVLLSGSMVAGADVGPIAQVSGARVLYRADARVDGVIELFVVPDDGSAPPLLLSGALVAGGNVNAFWAGEQFVVYQADAVVDGRDELYSVPLDGSAPPLALTPGLDVYRFYALARDGSRAVFSTYPHSEERLYVVLTDASSPPLDLAGSGIPTGFAATFFWQVELTGDGLRVVFLRAEDDDSYVLCELWSARLDGTSLVQLNPGPRFALTEFRLAPDGARVVYIDGDAISFAYSELVSARTDGTSWRILTPGAARPGAFRISDDSVFCVFGSREAGLTSLRLDRLDSSQPFELLAPSSATISDLELVRGSTTAVFLSQGVLYSLASPNDPVPVSGPGVTAFATIGFPYLAFSLDGSQLLYRSDESAAGVYDLYAAPVDGSAPPRQLNPPLSGERDVGDFRLSPDGRVVFRGDLVANDTFTLYGVPLDGARPARELNGSLAAGRDVLRYGEPVRARRPLRSP